MTGVQSTMAQPHHIEVATSDLDSAVPELGEEGLDTPALTKAQLAELLFGSVGLSKRESKELIDAFFELIAHNLVEGVDVRISGFGNFQIRTKAPRPGRNPRTGELIPIDARRVATFHASHKLKELIQNWDELDAGQRIG
jgi:integration host factor subunit alpha